MCSAPNTVVYRWNLSVGLSAARARSTRCRRQPLNRCISTIAVAVARLNSVIVGNSRKHAIAWLQHCGGLVGGGEHIQAGDVRRMSASRHMDALFLGCGMGSLGEPILGRPANHTQVTKVQRCGATTFMHALCRCYSCNVWLYATIDIGHDCDRERK